MAASIFGKFQYFNRTLALAVTLVAVSTFNYGFDNQAFATTQSMEPFIKQFGVYNDKSKSYELEAYWLSLFSSLNYIGFAFGQSQCCQLGITSSQKYQVSLWAVWCRPDGVGDGACSP